MSRRTAVLVAACVLGATPGGAGAGTTGGGPQPLNPPDVGPCASLPHPAPACSAVTVSCLVTCRTTGSTGVSEAAVRMLGLQLPRRYSRAVLTCNTTGGVRIACKLVSRTLMGKAGVHAAVMRLPQSFKSVRVTCMSRTKLVCAVKRVS